MLDSHMTDAAARTDASAILTAAWLDDNGSAHELGEISIAPSVTATLQDGIDVHDSEQVFSDFQRDMVGEQMRHRAENPDDLEKADGESPFDLREWFQGIEPESEAAGHKKRSLGVSWDNLTVVGAAHRHIDCPTIPAMALYEFIAPIEGLLKTFNYELFRPKPRNLIQGFTGAARPGEMVLVIGAPGSGCSTFLKAIANQRRSYLGVHGDVHYGGLTAKEMANRYQGEIAYCEEEDQHFATLTVAQTLDFALRLKASSQRLPEQSRHTFRKMIRDVMLKMLNLSHTKHTLVGSAAVRGVSGGERKRVSILETLATGATIISWDNSSKGLDASTALDYAKSMRVLTDVMQSTTFVSLYQVSETIWTQFDKVMVIDDSRCIYYGPRTEARDHFINLGFANRPRQPSADYITGCTDKHERIFQEGRDASSVPSTPEQLEEAYKASDIYSRELEIKQKYDRSVADGQYAERVADFKQAFKDSKHFGASNNSRYTVPFWEQVYALWLRQMQMIVGDKFDLLMAYITSITAAFLAGGIFFSLPLDTTSLFTRGGVLFTLLLFNSLAAFAELPNLMSGRPILLRQSGFAFYRPSALIVAQLLADIPFGVPKATIFIVITYFMAGLNRSASAFFILWITINISYYSFRALFSLFGTVTTNYFFAMRFGAIIMTIFVLWAGYVIPQSEMARWLYWVSYVSPVFYAFEACMVNEFMRIDLACDVTHIVPFGPGYPATVGPNQICAIAGAKPGQSVIRGMDYLQTSFGYQEAHLGRNIGILVGMLFGLILITCFIMEIKVQGATPAPFAVKTPPTKEEKKLNAKLQELKETRNADANDTLDVTGAGFTWSKLRYTVPVPSGKRVLLDNVDGYVKPGTLTALMGASGAGKTTLLDVLADRKTIGVVEGERLLEGRNIDISFQRQCGYAEQLDTHEPMCSVREALRFSAYLRQPYEVPKEEKDRYVEEILSLLEMHDLANDLVGFPGLGLNVADRKKLTIGVELAAKPRMLLFLDEPTSGLDGQSAFTICRLLRKLASNGQTILCTIHQPSALLFEMFDRLLLLEKGGKTVYFGPIGKDGEQLIDYLGAHGAHCPPGHNPAEYMLDAIGAGSRPRVSDKDWADHYLESELYQDNLYEISRLNEDGLHKEIHEGRKTEYATPWIYQFRIAGARTLLATWRQPGYQYTRLIQHLLSGVLAGLLFFQLPNTLASLQYRIFVIFQLAVIPAIIWAAIMPFWIFMRGIWQREETSKTFAGTVFATAQLIGEVPYAIVNATCFFAPIYYIAGFNGSADRAAFFWGISVLTELMAITLGTLIASACKNAYQAGLFVPFLAVIFALTSGVLSPPNLMSNGLFSKFLYNSNPIRFAIAPLVANELHGLAVECSTAELTSFPPPNGTTCAQYAGPFAKAVGGYLTNPTATDICHFCPISTGDQFLAPLGINYDERGRDAAILAGFVAFNIIGTILFTKFCKFSNR